MPQVDSVVANPPYTRWVEIRDQTREAIRKVIGKTLKDYELTGGIGNETGLYAHFIIFSCEFLKPKGRLGMIISNSWLQADYGVRLANFLLDRFKVKAVIDFNQRLFRIPLIATCVLLVERERREKARNQNKTAFIYIEEESEIEDILDAVKHPERSKDRFRIVVKKQGELPRDDNWLKIMFGADEIESKILGSSTVARIGSLFELAYGNISGVSARGGSGADKFFYLTNEDVRNKGLEDYVHPLLVGSRYTRHFIFAEEDWTDLRKKKKPCYVFLCHEQRDKLPKGVRNFIRWGETTPLVRARRGAEPKTANESMASKSRQKKKKEFVGWYDLGEVCQTSLFTPRRAQYHHRFIHTELSVGLDDSLITLFPRKKLTKTQSKAILAYLNSSFFRLFAEINGRSTGGGLIELDVKSIGRIPIIDPAKMTRQHAITLGRLFDKLEIASREIGGAHTKGKLEQLDPIVEEIDAMVVLVFKLRNEVIGDVRNMLRIMAER
ncbi:MAG: Eco57I restriction-modification methylase domain-containing protein, partial [Candidatus Thorarchaeota archaeon]